MTLNQPTEETRSPRIGEVIRHAHRVARPAVSFRRSNDPAMNEENPNPKPAANPAPPEDSAAALGAGPLQQAAVLVVDDSRTMRLALIRALNALGFRNITEATNGRQALELVLDEALRPDVARHGNARDERHGSARCPQGQS